MSAWRKRPSINEQLAVAYHETNLWLAQSSKGTWDYRVYTDDDRGWACDCPDWRYKLKDGVRVCKHITRVVAASGQIPNLEGADEQFVLWYVAQLRGAA